MIPATSGLLDSVNLQAYWKTQPRSHSHCQLATIAALRLPAAMKVALLVVALSCALPWAKPRCAAGMPDQVWSVLHRQLHGWPHVCPLVVFLAASGHQAIYFQQLPSRHMAGTLGSADCPAAGLGPATAPASGTNALAAAVSRNPVQVCCRRKHWHIVLPPLPACDERWRPWNHRTLQCQLLGGGGWCRIQHYSEECRRQLHRRCELQATGCSACRVGSSTLHASMRQNPSHCPLQELLLPQVFCQLPQWLPVTHVCCLAA